jgi:hypothetical protein
MSYKSKNRSVWCGENEEIDQLLYSIENTAVLSETCTREIIDICLVIVTNLKGNEEYVENKIKRLETEMGWLGIFSTEFRLMIISQLKSGVARQQQIIFCETVAKTQI